MAKPKYGATVNYKKTYKGTSDAPPSEAFESVRQVTDAMQDPRYEKTQAIERKSQIN